MARALAFTAENYEVVYEGLLNSQRGFDAPSETRIVGHILEKLEDIGEQTTLGTPPNTLTTYRLADGNGKLCTLTDEEYKLLVEALKGVKWMARVARKATAAIEWLEKAESS